jgi:hypothetical protein
MLLKRIVVGSQSKFYREGATFTLTAPGGTVSRTAKPDITDPAWLDIGPIKWSKDPSHKTEEYMVAAPGRYQAEDEIVLSVGLKLKGKLEKQSNFAVELALAAKATAAIPASPTAGGQYNPLAGSPVINGWLHVQEYNQDNTLLNTVDYFVALKVSGGTNADDKAAETPIEATVLFSTLNSGTLT